MFILCFNLCPIKELKNHFVVMKHDNFIDHNSPNILVKGVDWGIGFLKLKNKLLKLFALLNLLLHCQITRRYFEVERHNLELKKIKNSYTISKKEMNPTRQLFLIWTLFDFLEGGVF